MITAHRLYTFSSTDSHPLPPSSNLPQLALQMDPSSGTFVLEGVKLSLDLLKEISEALPPPTSAVVGLGQQIIAIVEVGSGDRLDVIKY